MADSKVADLTEDTNPALDDLVYKVVNAGTSGSDRKVQIGNLVGSRLLAESILGASATSVSFTSIPATYENLLLVMSLRSDRATTRDDVWMRFNNDSGGNYEHQGYSAQGTSVGGSSGTAQTRAALGTMAAASSTSGRAGTTYVFIPNYARTTLDKGWISLSAVMDGGGNFFNYAGLWLSTAAINRVDVLPGTGPNFVTGSSVSLYGLV